MKKSLTIIPLILLTFSIGCTIGPFPVTNRPFTPIPQQFLGHGIGYYNGYSSGRAAAGDPDRFFVKYPDYQNNEEYKANWDAGYWDGKREWERITAPPTN